MSSLVSVTSQGQISIPVKIRRKLGLDQVKKAYVTEEDGRVIVEPVRDISALAGSLHQYALQGKNLDEVHEIEKKAVETAVIERYQRKQKDESGSLIAIKPA